MTGDYYWKCSLCNVSLVPTPHDVSSGTNARIRCARCVSETPFFFYSQSFGVCQCTASYGSLGDSIDFVVVAITSYVIPWLCVCVCNHNWVYEWCAACCRSFQQQQRQQCENRSTVCNAYEYEVAVLDYNFRLRSSFDAKDRNLKTNGKIIFFVSPQESDEHTSPMVFLLAMWLAPWQWWPI